MLDILLTGPSCGFTERPGADADLAQSRVQVHAAFLLKEGLKPVASLVLTGSLVHDRKTPPVALERACPSGPDLSARPTQLMDCSGRIRGMALLEEVQGLTAGPVELSGSCACACACLLLL